MDNRKKELIRAVKFTLFSISAGIIQVLSFALMNEVFTWSYRVCYFTALVQLHAQPQYYLPLGKQRADRHAEGGGLLPRVHAAEHMGGRCAHGAWVERISGAGADDDNKLRDGVSVRPIRRVRRQHRHRGKKEMKKERLLPFLFSLCWAVRSCYITYTS